MSSTGMWKQLFDAPPPDAMQSLLTPRRKFVYGMIAFAPGTLLALSLNSVKRRMDEENEQLRLQHVNDELAGEAAREKKDVVLMQMIEELRERIQQLEREARGDTIANKASERPAADASVVENSVTTNDDPPTPARAPQSESVQPARTELPAFLTEYEGTLRPWLDRFDKLKSQLEKAQERLAAITTKDDESSTATTPSVPVRQREQGGVGPSGIRERIAERERVMLAQDIRAHKQQESQSTRSP